MNIPRTVITYINVAHFIDHYAMLVFAAAVIVMAPVFGMRYADLLPYATPALSPSVSARCSRDSWVINGADAT